MEIDLEIVFKKYPNAYYTHKFTELSLAEIISLIHACHEKKII